MKKLNILKNMGIVVAALFIVACLVSNIAAAESKVVGKKEVASKEIKKDKTGKKTGGKKKSKGKVLGACSWGRSQLFAITPCS